MTTIVVDGVLYGLARLSPTGKTHLVALPISPQSRALCGEKPNHWREWQIVEGHITCERCKRGAAAAQENN